jgi:uncharacterized RDD family membrane protein YckC
MEQQENYLQDLEQEFNYEYASTGQRFANYIVDLIVFYVVMFVISFFTAAMNLSSNQDYYSENSETLLGSKILDYIFSIALYILIYTIIEGASKGRTLGKLITGTKAVKEDGNPITWNEALIRSLCRVVPFEPFSAFGTPWHDKWSHTMVVKNRKY